jgi:HlyD family secretion protein
MDVDFTPQAKTANTNKVSGIKQSLNTVFNLDGKKFPVNPDSKRFLLIVFAVAAAVVIIGTIGFFVFNKPANKKQPVMTVSYETADYHPIKRTLSINGSVSAWDPLSIGSEVNGLRIDSVRVEEGMHVKKGDILATLNSSVLQAQLEQEQARFLASKASLSKAIQPNRREDINALRAQLSQAKATVAQEQAVLIRSKSNAANARANADRYTDLARQGAISQMEADNKATEAIAATAEVTNAEKRVEAAHFAQKQAEERLNMAVSGGRYEDVLMSQASVKETQARVKQLAAQVEQTIIRAPDDGQIVKRDAHLGEITSAGKTLFSMVRDNRLELRAQAPEVDLPKIKSGQNVQITSGTDNQVNFTGKVREISPLVDPSTRLGTIRIDIPNGSYIYPGMFFHGTIELGEDRAITLPTSAVLSNDDGSQVFVLKPDDTVQSRVVATGSHDGKQVEIISGLNTGEKVVVLGAGFLKDGDLVRVSSNNFDK